MADFLSVPLRGRWWLREALGETWRWWLRSQLPQSDAPKPLSPGEVSALNSVGGAEASAGNSPGWIAAQVPGSVIGDLVKAGELPEPRHDRDSRCCEWTAARHWVYRRRIEFDDGALALLRSGARAQLVFEGVDPSARVFIDREPVGELSGPFGTQSLDITDRLDKADLAAGADLAVVVAPVPPGEPQVGRTDQVSTHSPRMNYGWDFCPRFPHQGLWRPVRLEIGVLLREAGFAVGLEQGLGVVEFSAQCASPIPTGLSLEASLPGRTYRAALSISPNGEVRGSLALPDVPLWHPWGFGGQTLIPIRVLAGDGTVLIEKATGFRSLEWRRNPGSEPGSLPYTVFVNGRRIPGNGYNWVPVDAQHGAVSQEKLAQLLRLAKAANGRLLRVWGGGLLETPDFYSLCDQLGLLVWQEFSQSSSGMQSAPSTAPAFVGLMRAEATQAVRERGHHPSLVLWDGGNELQTEQGPLQTGQSPVLRALADEVARLDPGSGWLPTSPSGRFFAFDPANSAVDPGGSHDVHGPWEHQGLAEHAAFHNKASALAHTEFGAEAMSSARQLAALIPEEKRWPPTRANASYRHLGQWWNNAELVDAAFGNTVLRDTPANPAELDAALERCRRGSQLLQATGLGYAVEADRRRSPRCSLVLPWQLNESFPNAWCTALVDFCGDAKPALWQVAKAFAACRVSLAVPRDVWAGESRLSAEAWLWDEEGFHSCGPTAVVLRLRNLAGTELASTRESIPTWDGSPAKVLALEVANDPALPELLLWEAEWLSAEGIRIDLARRPLGTGTHWGALLGDPAFQTSPAEVELACQQCSDGWQLQLSNLGLVALVGLRVCDARPFGAPGFLTAPTDPEPLLPAESRQIFCQQTEAASAGLAVSIDWANNSGPPIRHVIE
ncbi:MAG: hypothetical protein LBI99_11380 [Propionibacteriaceae bacterium]|jgi:beta-mannosidase|nr:hypothetical protein [Propionibacteriaceae bacterium]